MMDFKVRFENVPAVENGQDATIPLIVLKVQPNR